MEARKTKNKLLKEIFGYAFLIVCIALTIITYNNKADIVTFFDENVTGNNVIDAMLKLVPNIIYSLQIIVVAVVLNKIIKIIALLSFMLTDRAKTIVNIFVSLIKWIIILCTIFFILAVWGIDTKTLLAGTGIVAMVIGFGAQSLVSDILSGIFIVLEGEYVVGDIVVIDGWRGKIINMGIRTVQIQDIAGNIKIINNSEIRSVINQTKNLSLASVKINVTSEHPLEEIEKIIIDALPEIRKNVKGVKEEITYKGITEITDITTELLFRTRCYEEDLFQVQRDILREIKLLLDKNGIENFAPPTYNIVENK